MQAPHPQCVVERENQPLITCEPVEFEKSLVEVQDFKKITRPF
jgi:hypothetical protein